jgi:hypothetical protein
MGNYHYNAPRKTDALYDLPAIAMRLLYLCETRFGGVVSAFAARANINRRILSAVIMRAKVAPRPRMLSQIIASGVVNAEWLMCGTGPMLPEEPDPTKSPLVMAEQIHSSYQVFDTTLLAAQACEKPAHVSRPRAPDPVAADFILPHKIHAARIAEQPVWLQLNKDSIRSGAGFVAIDLVRAGYVTNIVLSPAAASADVELAVFGGTTGAAVPDVLARLNSAAHMAAAHGVGYGEALGRWVFETGDDRARSLVAVCFEMGVPVAVYGGIGGAFHHLMPARRGAELGAALGAAMYVDTLALVAQIVSCTDEPGGVFIATDDSCAELHAHALAAGYNAHKKDVQVGFNMLSGAYRHSVPALLSACNSVYEGTAVNGKQVRSRL